MFFVSIFSFFYVYFGGGLGRAGSEVVVRGMNEGFVICFVFRRGLGWIGCRVFSGGCIGFCCGLVFFTRFCG